MTSSIEEMEDSVRKSFGPELELISDDDLREKVVKAWALSLAGSEFRSVEEITGSGGPETSPIRGQTQVEHIRGVTQMSLGLAERLESVVGDCRINRDLLIACALCHDVGKPFEFSPSNQRRWKEDSSASGHPAIRHSVYGVHICLTVGLPEAVAHTAGAHSGEGELITRSLENTIVHFADHAFWAILERSDMLEPVDGRVLT